MYIITNKRVTWRNKTVEVKEIFGTRIKELREENGYGVREFAGMLGISHSALLNYEKGERAADIDVCQKAATIFNVTGDYLLGISDERR